jgi:hypothetical protein
MAISTLTPQEINYEGVEGYSDTGEYTALAVEGLQVVNDGKTFVHIKNDGSSGDLTVTLDTPKACNYGGTTVHDVSIVIPQGDDYFIGPFLMSRFNASNTGYVTMTCSHADTVTARAYKFSY